MRSSLGYRPTWNRNGEPTTIQYGALRAGTPSRVTRQIREIRELRALSTQVAMLNELRGVREDLLAVRAGQQRAEQAQAASQEQLRQLQAALQRRRWWQVWRQRPAAGRDVPL